MADKKLNELGTIESFDNAYVELSQNQYRISKTNLGKQLTNEVHTNFSVASSDPAYIFAQKSDGTNFRISKADLAKAIRNDAIGLGGEQSGNRALYDGCFIMYHNQPKFGNLRSFPYAVPYASWTSLQNNGEEADGVLIVEGGHSLVVAPHEASCRWSSKNGIASQPVDYNSVFRTRMLDTWDGKERTAKICTDSSSPFYQESINSTYAPGYCHNYTPHDTRKGLSAGKYWLPCVAELMMIYTHKYRINAGLALISGANQLSETNYWSSTESSNVAAWTLNLQNGSLGILEGKNSIPIKTRPVSAFIDDAY